MKTAFELIEWYHNEIEHILSLEERLQASPLSGMLLPVNGVP